jgi:hypothetical protein
MTRIFNKSHHFLTVSRPAENKALLPRHRRNLALQTQESVAHRSIPQSFRYAIPPKTSMNR